MTPEGEVQHEVKRRTEWIVKRIMFALIFVPIAIFVFGEVIHLLWNWLMPTLFHLSSITFWQALGLMVLSWLLFGGLRGAGRFGPRHGGPWRRRMRAHWEEMTPEERDKFREWARGRCGPVRAAAPPKA
jgi:Ca2+/H+ antiporter, TMEM165/GDT1 family